MPNVLDLPIEILDNVFDYLKAGDQAHAKLVCRHWKHQLSSLRYRKTTKLQLTPHFVASCQRVNGSIQQAIGRASHHHIEVTDFYALSGRAEQQCIVALKQLLQASCMSLVEELSLEDCSEQSLTVVFGVLGKARQIRRLRVDLHRFLYRSVSLPKVPRAVGEPDAFAGVTHLEVTLGNGSCVELVGSLAAQLTHLALTVYRKELLVRCCNEIRLPALLSLTVATADAANVDFVQPGELGGGCWRTLEQLQSFRCTDATLLYMVLAEMLRHFRNLKRLAIEHSNLSHQCIEQIGHLTGLTDLQLTLFRSIGSTSRNPPTFHLPNVERLHLSTENDVRLGKQLPNLTSMVIENPLQSFCPKAILSQVKQIVGNGGRRLGKLLLKRVHLDREAAGCLGTFSIGVLAFERCHMDGSILEALAQTVRGTIYRIAMDDCFLTFKGAKSYSIRSVAELRANCPYLQIASTGTRILFA